MSSAGTGQRGLEDHGQGVHGPEIRERPASGVTVRSRDENRGCCHDGFAQAAQEHQQLGSELLEATLAHPIDLPQSGQSSGVAAYKLGCLPVGEQDVGRFAYALRPFVPPTADCLVAEFLFVRQQLGRRVVPGALARASFTARRFVPAAHEQRPVGIPLELEKVVVQLDDLVGLLQRLERRFVETPSTRVKAESQQLQV